MTPTLNALLDVVDDASDREHQGFQEVFLGAHSHQGLGVLIEEVIEALSLSSNENIQQQS